MITLYQFQAAFNQVSGSPFSVKGHVLLKMAGRDYVVENLVDPRKAPKGKLPYIDDEGEKIADTAFIRQHLERKYQVDLDAGLNAAERATARAFASLMEDHLYWAGVYSRWIDDAGWPIVRDTFFTGLPGPLKVIIPPIARSQVRKQIWGHGLGRHSANEIYALAGADIEAVSDFLADKPFFMGKEPTSADASVYPMIAAIVEAPFESPLKKTGLARENLTAYCERMRGRYFSD